MVKYHQTGVLIISKNNNISFIKMIFWIIDGHRLDNNTLSWVTKIIQISNIN